MKIKEQTRKLAIDSSKSCFESADTIDRVSSRSCFEVVYKTAGVSSKSCFESAYKTAGVAQSPALRLQIRLPKSVTDT